MRPNPKHTHAIYKFTRWAGWVAVGFLVLGLFLDYILAYQMRFAKGFALGVGLSYGMYSVFTYLNYRQNYHNQNGKNAGTQMMSAMYMAILTKWMLGILGFALIFVFFKQVMTVAVFLGFIAMQLAVGIGLYRLGRVI